MRHSNSWSINFSLLINSMYYRPALRCKPPQARKQEQETSQQHQPPNNQPNNPNLTQSERRTPNSKLRETTIIARYPTLSSASPSFMDKASKQRRVSRRDTAPLWRIKHQWRWPLPPRGRSQLTSIRSLTSGKNGSTKKRKKNNLPAWEEDRSPHRDSLLLSRSPSLFTRQVTVWPRSTPWMLPTRIRIQIFFLMIHHSDLSNQPQPKPTRKT